MDGPAFAAYVREVLTREIAPGTAVILDNLTTHRNKEAAAALKAHGCWFLYLPPYSSDRTGIRPAQCGSAQDRSPVLHLGLRGHRRGLSPL